MSELEIPEAAWVAARSRDYPNDLKAAAPLIVAAELRRIAAELEPEQDRMREEDGRGFRSSTLGVAIVRLRERSDELDPQGAAS